MINKMFDSLEDAMAYFYDNELDAEFSKRSNETKYAGRNYIAFACARNKGSENSGAYVRVVTKEC